uniref:MYND-type domain-containing protein n=1 Tax=Chromera velia CCMP2878 TaxID=1169474 RepID=A0A0G4GI42_9ALVE|eukprot:Cvel_4737.t1-p1 / transcript=Cvel_4737.t1 / gene=Cvel_4737 / organism=Chromera_velia_CCMP2878 / gene_product=hypothetical protein / transcript_product=hypothetical protein / location=Cvel_scaffold211:7591-8178(+) / protein_length=196 / sequence_SO=supercontig / SO=protein_coding / is_pseudo=false
MVQTFGSESGGGFGGNLAVLLHDLGRYDEADDWSAACTASKSLIRDSSNSEAVLRHANRLYQKAENEQGKDGGDLAQAKKDREEAVRLVWELLRNRLDKLTNATTQDEQSFKRAAELLAVWEEGLKVRVKEEYGLPGCIHSSTTAKMSVCARCKQVAYCGHQYQKQHWKEHKKTCSPSEIVQAAAEAKKGMLEESE